MPRTAPLLILLTLLAPVVQAGWLDRTVEIDIAELRVGDTLRYLVAHDTRTEAQTSASSSGSTSVRAEADGPDEMVVLVEGPATAADAYGIARPTTAFRSDVLSGGDVLFSQRCHVLRDGREHVRTDVLAGAYAAVSGGWGVSWGAGPLQMGQEVRSDSTFLTSFLGSCEAAHPLAGATLREGDRLASLDLLLPGISFPFPPKEVLTSPGRPLEFHGRDALAFDLDLDEVWGIERVDARATFVFADGLPGAVDVVMTTSGEDGAYTGTFRLDGYAQGDGEVVRTNGPARLPERHPEGAFVRAQPLAFDDRAFALRFPYAEALAAARADPVVGLDAFLRARPDAVLAVAFYDEGDWNAIEAPGLRAEATWTLTFSDATRAKTVVVTRYAPPDGAPSLPTRLTRAQDAGETSPLWDGPRPEEFATSATLARSLAAVGVERVRALVWSGSPMGVQLYASEIPFAPEEGTAEGESAGVDAATGAALYAMTSVVESRSTGLLPSVAAPAPLPQGRGDGFSALAGPASGLGLAGGAATGAALLLVLKFLVIPFYTRLRRDRLLDNPVRARLYERVRAEPGIHRAELVDFAGVGEGATRHHLRQLVAHRLLVETGEGGFVRYFCAGEVPPDVARREGVLRAGRAREVYELLRAQPHLSLREAAARLGMSAPSVFRVKRRLEKAGLLPAAAEADAALA